MSFCSSWLPAWRAAVSSVISQKWETQLKWQVAASSSYDKRAEMCRVTGSGASTAAESLSLERTHSTSGGLNSVYPHLGTPFPCYLICKSTEKFDLRYNEVPGSSARCRSLLLCFNVTWCSATEIGTVLRPLLTCFPGFRAATLIFVKVVTGDSCYLEPWPASTLAVAD